MKQVNITLPPLTKNNFVTAYAQVRPYRKGGIRVQHEQINDKHIFHNYGHGGAGVSLSFGSAYISTKSLYIFMDVNRSLDIAVIGCGIIGLLTGLELTKRGHKVQIFAQKLPELGQKDNSKLSTSQCAPGLWLPYGYDSQADPLKHELFSKLSYDYFKDCAKTSRYKAIKAVKIYDKFLDEEIIRQNFPEWMTQPNISKVKVNFKQSGISEEYTYFESYKINMELFLEELKTEFILRGGKLIQKTFRSIEDVLKLNEKYIFNCSAMGSRKIFGDQNMVGIRGHLLEFTNPDPKIHNYFLRSKVDVHEEAQNIEDGKFDKLKEKEKIYRSLINNVCIYCHDQKIIVGLTKEDGQEEPIVNGQIVKLMMQTLQSFLSQRALKPKL